MRIDIKLRKGVRTVIENNNGIKTKTNKNEKNTEDSIK